MVEAWMLNGGAFLWCGGLGKREVVSGEKNCTYRALEVHGLHRSLELEWGV